MNPTEIGHSQVDKPATLRLPESFYALEDWARAHGMHDVLEVAYLSLGQHDDPKTIRNYTNELTKPDFDEIQQGWRDHPVAHRLWKFAHTLEGTESPPQGADSIFMHKGQASKTKRQFPNTPSPAFLLAMISNPLHYERDRVEHVERQRLRAWLMVQAAIRIIDHQCIADKNIRNAASYLTIGSTDYTQWAFLDKLLLRTAKFSSDLPPTFTRFTRNLGKAATQLKDSSNSRTQNGFLNSLIKIANGTCAPIPKTDSEQPGISTNNFPLFERKEPEPWSLFDEEDAGTNVLYLPSEAGGDDVEADQDMALVDIDPNSSEEEQALTSRAIFLHDAEESHYLPWSWDKLLPPEITQLDLWIGRYIGDDNPILSVGAAITRIATVTGRSLFHTVKFEINDGFSEEWSLSADFRNIKRIAPRRDNSWQPDTPDAQAEIAPFHNELVFELPEDVIGALFQAAQRLPNSPRSLSELWRATHPNQKITKWFDDQAKQHFPRVTSGKLAQVAGQRLFEKTGDQNLARIALAPPRCGLPAACGYAAWDVTSLAQGLPLSPVINPTATLRSTVLGSLLAPLESVLHHGIAEARSALQNAIPTDLVTFHNGFTSYCVMALYAGTGCRHLKSPFESLAHFNLEARCVYINDKSDGGLHHGRMVPLPEKLVSIVRQYLRYLQILIRSLAALRPELSAELSTLLEGKQASLPLFFLLDTTLHWHQMTDPDMPGLPIFHWSLPYNLFRHRYSQQLSDAGVPIDIVDGWMGHAERAVSTYGDYSPRCWSDDARKYADVVDRVFDGLGFETIEVPTSLPLHNPAPTSGVSTYIEPRHFGFRERQRSRRKRHREAIKLAKAEITEFLEGRELDELTQDQLDALGKRLLLRDNGLPHPDAAKRYRELVKFIKTSGGKHSRSIRQRLALQNTEKSLVSPALPASLTALQGITRWANKTKKDVQKAKLSRRDALCIGAALLCIEKKLSYQRFLLDVVRGENFQLVQRKKAYYIEYSEEWGGDAFSTPVQRHQISYKTASLLHYGLGRSQKMDPKTRACPKRLHELCRQLVKGSESPETMTIKQAFDRMTAMIEQTNLILLPGMVAASLSKRMPPTSLSWSDVLRIQEDTPVKTIARETDSKTSTDWETPRLNQGLIAEDDPLVLQVNAKRFYDEIMHLLGQYTRPTALKNAEAVEKVCARYNGKVSSSVLLLGHWISQVIRQGKNKGRGKHFKPYAPSTIRTYFSALRLAFEGLAYQFDLFSADSEDITDLYAAMLESRREQDKRTNYLSLRLKEFQRWAATLGVDIPDWGELDTDDNYRSVSPGCLSEKDYLNCQNLIINQFGRDSDEALFLGFVLLLAFRFGLRASEAIGLRRRDWCDSSDWTWVLVRNNHLRQLKRPSSRRAVPLFFAFAEREREIIEKVLNRHDMIAGIGSNAPLLCEVRNGNVCHAALTKNVSVTLIDLIRAATTNPSLNLHHCRHSFYNHLVPILFGFESKLTSKLCNGLDPTSLRQQILGEQHDISRRSGMAIARLMGHYRPNSGLKSYSHLTTEWADALTPVKSERARKIEGMTSADDFDRIPLETTKIHPQTLEFQKPTLLLIVKLLRLAAQGKTFERAAELLSLHPDLASTVETVVTEANGRMRFKQKGENDAWLLGKHYPYALLHYVSDAGWRRLLEQAEKNVDSPPCTDGPALPPLYELACMLGMNRHVHMSHIRHCNLVKAALMLFDVSDTKYQVFAEDDLPGPTSLLEEAGFTVSKLREDPEQKYEVQLDKFFIEVEGTPDRRFSYGSLILKRSSEGVIRNSFELAIALLATGVLLNDPVAHQLKAA